jgi:hypothetical protein
MRIIFPSLPLEPSVILKKADPEAMIATPRLAERLLLGGLVHTSKDCPLGDEESEEIVELWFSGRAPVGLVVWQPLSLGCHVVIRLGASASGFNIPL